MRPLKYCSPDATGVISFIARFANERFRAIRNGLRSRALQGNLRPAANANFAFITLPGSSNSRTAAQANARSVVMLPARDAKQLRIISLDNVKQNRIMRMKHTKLDTFETERQWAH